MSKIGVFPIPGELTSEDKWFRYFNRKQAATIVICGIIDYRVILSANENDLLLPAIIIMLIFTMTVMGIVLIRLPVDALFLAGGGLTVDQLIFRLLYRLRNRALYTKCSLDEEECL